MIMTSNKLGFPGSREFKLEYNPLISIGHLTSPNGLIDKLVGSISSKSLDQFLRKDPPDDSKDLRKGTF